jgi:type IV secretion system protein VirB11
MTALRYAAGSEGLFLPLQPYLQDTEVSEILVNKPQEIWVERQGIFYSYPIPEFTESHLHRLFMLIANENIQNFSAQQPLLSGNLFDGSRVQLCIPPVSKYPTMAIRRKVVRKFSLEDYALQNFYMEGRAERLYGDFSRDQLSSIDQKLLDFYEKSQWDSFVKLAIQSRKNMVISGGTSSGKTTFLNACLREINPQDRLLILEDTREIETLHQNQVQLLVSKGEQGTAKISMQDLVQCCLRLRPDRIIMGEIRGKEVIDFVSACSTGHEGSLTTIHANSPRLAFMRMSQMYKLNNIPSMTDQDILKELTEVIDIIIQINKTPSGRKVHGVYFRHGEKNENIRGAAGPTNDFRA